MVTIDKIACELFGYEGHENDEEMQSSLNYIDKLFKPGDVITFKVEIRKHSGFRLKGFYSLVRFQCGNYEVEKSRCSYLSQIR